MPATNYTYSIQNDFPNQKMDSARLQLEIASSEITVALSHINTNEDSCVICFKDGLTQAALDILDVIIASHSGEMLPVDPKDAQGAPYVSLLLGKPGLQLCIKGVLFTAEPDATTDKDTTFPEDREIQGSWLSVSDNELGDYVEMFVCMPDGTPAGQFGETVYIPPNGRLDQIVAEGTAPVPAGLKIRLRYVAVATGSTRTIVGWHRLRK